jgi:hypothetical protein
MTVDAKCSVILLFDFDFESADKFAVLFLGRNKSHRLGAWKLWTGTKIST